MNRSSHSPSRSSLEQVDLARRPAPTSASSGPPLVRRRGAGRRPAAARTAASSLMAPPSRSGRRVERRQLAGGEVDAAPGPGPREEAGGRELRRDRRGSGASTSTPITPATLWAATNTSLRRTGWPNWRASKAKCASSAAVHRRPRTSFGLAGRLRCAISAHADRSARAARSCGSRAGGWGRAARRGRPAARRAGRAEHRSVGAPATVSRDAGIRRPPSIQAALALATSAFSRAWSSTSRERDDPLERAHGVGRVGAGLSIVSGSRATAGRDRVEHACRALGPGQRQTQRARRRRCPALPSPVR